MSESAETTIGLFGGSFDPVHLGHLLVAQAAREELGLSRLFFIPTARSPFKPGASPADSQVRLRLLRLALAGEPHCEIDPQEIDRGGISYSIDTVSTYARRFPGARLYYLIGTDHLSELHTWREAPKLAELVEFLVIPRPGRPPVDVPPPFRVRLLRGFPVMISSTHIRSRINSGLSVKHLVPRAVEEEIRNNHLYFSGG